MEKTFDEICTDISKEEKIPKVMIELLFYDSKNESEMPEESVRRNVHFIKTQTQNVIQNYSKENIHRIIELLKSPYENRYCGGLLMFKINKNMIDFYKGAHYEIARYITRCYKAFCERKNLENQLSMPLEVRESIKEISFKNNISSDFISDLILVAHLKKEETIDVAEKLNSFIKLGREQAIEIFLLLSSNDEEKELEAFIKIGFTEPINKQLLVLKKHFIKFVKDKYQIMEGEQIIIPIQKEIDICSTKIKEKEEKSILKFAIGTSKEFRDKFLENSKQELSPGDKLDLILEMIPRLDEAISYIKYFDEFIKIFKVMNY